LSIDQCGLETYRIIRTTYNMILILTMGRDVTVLNNDMDYYKIRKSRSELVY